MCGIAGIASPDPSQLRPLPAMTRALRHRGPDDEGYCLGRSRSGRVSAHGGADTVREICLPPFPADPPEGADVALGHRRLAIIDLSPGGHGPMASRDARFWITYNGEVFNYVELRQELQALGHTFRTASDTEVLLAAWEQWGPEALDRLNGMWAFALYDARDARLFCARDRFGVKPFFYSWDGHLMAFASEIKALLAHPAVVRRPDLTTLSAYLVHGAVDEGADTFFENVRSLPPGHHLTYDVRARRLSVARWYVLPNPEPRPGRPEEIRSLLEDAVRLRLRSDVAVGTCLSGGLDSSSLVALTARLRDPAAATDRTSFSVVYDDPGLAEAAFVRTVVEATGVRNVVATPTSAEFLTDLPHLTHHQDEPFPSPGVYSQWRVMRLAREAGVGVLLDGQGADEVLGGYHYHFGPYLAEVARRRGLAATWTEVRSARAATGRSLGFFLGLLAHQTLPVPAWLRTLALQHGATQGRVPTGLLCPWFRALADARPTERHQVRPDLLAERRASILTASLPALLRYEDRSSMAFSIEARTPFLDYRLVERALALPASDLIRTGWTKAILREAVHGLVPDKVRFRRDKLGFATPEVRWLTELAPEVRVWLGPGSRTAPYVERRAMEAWLREPDRILAARPGLFRLLSAELWLRSFEETPRAR